jgi:quinol monooxygenase YgiN
VVYVIIERYKDAAAVAAQGQSERAKAMFAIRLTKKAPRLRRGLCSAHETVTYRLTVMLA